MQEKAGAQISARAFVQSLVILLILMLVAGVLTRTIPAGSYTRTLQAGREIIDPQSFHLVARPNYAVWRWFTAPFEVLWGPDGVTIITIIVFLLMVGSSFAVLDKGGVLRALIARIVKSLGGRKYLLLLAISFFFMLLGALFGIFEEVVPLVPLMIALSYLLGWDSLVGLGMSILATNMGFSAAITNPFTIGVAQKLAGLPLFSGAWLRVLIFAAVYSLLAVFLTRYARRIDRAPQSSPVFEQDRALRDKYQLNDLGGLGDEQPRLGKAMAWFAVCLVLILIVLVSSPFVAILSQISLPLVGLLFLIGGIGASWAAGMGGKAAWASALEGMTGIAPSIPLILMAASVKYIVAQGGIMDTILHSASLAFSQASPIGAALMVYVIALLIEFFVASGSAKAFLLMPILLPIADLVGVTRQVAVTAYCFGDGFSNLAYPTNPVLLICLGLTVVSYPQWLRWTAKLWLGVIVVTIAFLTLGVLIRFGPF